MIPLLLQQQRQDADYKQVYPFSSARKRMSCLIRRPDGKLRLYMKGAAELMLDLCDRQLTKDGNVVVCALCWKTEQHCP
jgi:magnesium-transporting ATPase (P-type)